MWNHNGCCRAVVESAQVRSALKPPPVTNVEKGSATDVIGRLKTAIDAKGACDVRSSGWPAEPLGQMRQDPRRDQQLQRLPGRYGAPPGVLSPLLAIWQLRL
ncbi:unnamed protein product [Ectocarpus sp. 6 AP-2014]